MNLKMSKKIEILVTGAEGFIGSHFLQTLIKTKKYNITALVLYNSFNSTGWIDSFSNLEKKKINIIFGDIRDGQFIDTLIKGKDVVVNLAALIGIPYSYVAPKSYIDVNISGLMNLMHSSMNHNVKRFIQISTSEVYGVAKYFPIKETEATVANSPYAASKIAAESICISYFKAFNFPVVILRPFNTFGPRQSARAIIPTIINQLLSNKKKIKLGNVKVTRDFNFVRDITKGIEKSVSKINIHGQIINIGSGYEISITKLFKMILKIMKKEAKIITEKSRVRPDKSEVKRLKADNSKAKKILGWKPKIAGKRGLEQGLKETIKWFEDNQNIHKINNDYNI
jgi:dTDP-glucose 4,6-dehydratase